jgi:hypothetical protein
VIAQGVGMELYVARLQSLQRRRALLKHGSAQRTPGVLLDLRRAMGYYERGPPPAAVSSAASLSGCHEPGVGGLDPIMGKHQQEIAHLAELDSSPARCEHWCSVSSGDRVSCVPCRRLNRPARHETLRPTGPASGAVPCTGLDPADRSNGSGDGNAHVREGKGERRRTGGPRIGYPEVATGRKERTGRTRRTVAERPPKPARDRLLIRWSAASLLPGWRSLLVALPSNLLQDEVDGPDAAHAILLG